MLIFEYTETYSIISYGLVCCLENMIFVVPSQKTKIDDRNTIKNEDLKSRICDYAVLKNW